MTIGNFYLLGQALKHVLTPEASRKTPKRFILFFLLKFGLFFAVFSVALRSGQVDLLGLFLGCSVVVASIFVIVPVTSLFGYQDDEDFVHG